MAEVHGNWQWCGNVYSRFSQLIIEVYGAPLAKKVGRGGGGLVPMFIVRAHK